MNFRIFIISRDESYDQNKKLKSKVDVGDVLELGEGQLFSRKLFKQKKIQKKYTNPFRQLWGEGYVLYLSAGQTDMIFSWLHTIFAFWLVEDIFCKRSTWRHREGGEGFRICHLIWNIFKNYDVKVCLGSLAVLVKSS